MTTIYINGCSHTHGTRTSLDGDLSQSFPELLRSDYTVINDSYVGCSNDRIFRTTIEHCTYDTPDVAIIQFTYPNRFESPSDQGIKQHLPEQSKENFYLEHWDKSKHSHTMIRIMLPKIIALQHYFEEIGIDYGFIIWPNMSEAYDEPLWRAVDKSKVINEGCMDTLLHSWGHKLTKKPHLEYPDVLDRHYDAAAHKFIADGVREYISSGDKMVPYDDWTPEPEVNLIYV